MIKGSKELLNGVWHWVSSLKSTRKRATWGAFEANWADEPVEQLLSSKAEDFVNALELKPLERTLQTALRRR